MCRLYNEVLNAVVYSSLECLINVVDLLSVTCIYVVDDDLCCESSSYRPVRVSFLQSLLDSADVLCTALVEGCTKAYNEKFVLADLILVQRIILRCITCVSSEVIRISELALYLFLLLISQSIPCLLGSFALSISIICILLYVDGIDQSSAFCSRVIRLCLLSFTASASACCHE